MSSSTGFSFSVDYHIPSPLNAFLHKKIGAAIPFRRWFDDEGFGYLERVKVTLAVFPRLFEF